ncbi:MAG: hypothetical protein MRJ68_11740 [Nitrospira sp.]|nr:hypothetical protein [Nitrospira sp.]
MELRERPVRTALHCTKKRLTAVLNHTDEEGKDPGSPVEAIDSTVEALQRQK